MELCTEGNLKKYVARNKNTLLVKLTDSRTVVVPNVAKWCAEMAEGMCYLSSKEVRK
jgi:hypothetical protein